MAVRRNALRYYGPSECMPVSWTSQQTASPHDLHRLHDPSPATGSGTPVALEWARRAASRNAKRKTPRRFSARRRCTRPGRSQSSPAAESLLHPQLAVLDIMRADCMDPMRHLLGQAHALPLRSNQTCHSHTISESIRNPARDGPNLDRAVPSRGRLSCPPRGFQALTALTCDFQ